MRHETFSTPGPVTLDIRIPAGDIEIETDDAVETAVELQARGRDAEALEQRRRDLDATSRRRLRGARRGRPRARWVPRPARRRVPGAYGGAARRDRPSEPRIGGHLRARTLFGARGQGRVRRRRVRGRVGRGRRQRRVGRRPARPRRQGEDQLGLGRRQDRRVGGGRRREHGLGDVEIDSVVSGDVRINSASGDIEVGIAKGSRLLVDAQTLSGDTSSELDLESGSTIETDEVRSSS